MSNDVYETIREIAHLSFKITELGWIISFTLFDPIHDFSYLEF